VAALTSDNTENAAASPYVIAMTNLGVTALPHLVNALLVTSIFSAGNTYTYCATRSLYGLALEGRAPRFLRKCTSSGVPLACFGIVICFPFLSFMAVSKGSAQVLKWLVSLVTAGGLIDYIVICITYLRFYYACRLQKIDRSTFPYVGRLQPFCGWVGLVCMSLVCLLYGYATLRPILYIVWKLLKGTRIVSLQEIDLVWERPIIDAYEAGLEGQPSTFWAELGHLFARSKNKEPAPDCHADESAIPMLSVVAEAKT
jgi:yeast amino acid transporter